MNSLLHKLNYKNQARILIINAEKVFIKKILSEIPSLQIDTKIDPRFPYGFMLIFVRYLQEVEEIVPKAVHNLVSDGVLWFACPKKGSRRISSDLDPDHGWETLTQTGFDKVRHVMLDDKWMAIRFRNVRYIRHY
jgi:hypothetical protein